MSDLWRRFKDHFVLYGNKDLSVEEMMYYYSLYIVFIFAAIAFISNTIIGMPWELNFVVFGGMVLAVVMYWLARYKRKVFLSQIIFVVLLFFSFNGLWFYSEGSSGSTPILLQCFMMLFIFFCSGRFLKIVVVGLFVDILVLFGIELFCREAIQPYQTPDQRTLDVLSMTMLFWVFVLPLLFFAKRAIINQRNNAIASENVKTQYFLELTHEIRTPMNAILGFTELLEDEHLEPEYRKEYLSIINKNGQHLLSLLNNVLSISKLEARLTPVVVQRVNAGEVVVAVYKSFQSHLNKVDGVDFRMDLPDEEVVLNSDMLMITQILTNVVANAIKFTEKGFVEVGCRNHDGEGVLFYVADSGIGILPEHQKAIFSNFQQSHQTLKSSSHQGAGLGLAICKGMVDLLGGKIWVESKLGSGTTFKVLLPFVSNPVLVDEKI